MAKIVISAQIDLPADKREEALKTAQPFIDGALSQEGCLHYDWSADLNNPTRINVFEEWTSEEALASHFANKHYSNSGLIDSSLTCDLKVNYLKDQMQNNLANLYSGQCDAIYRNKVLVMN